MICAPLKKKKVSDLLKNLEKAQKITDLVEIWFDNLTTLSEKTLKKIFSKKTKPFIYKSQNLKNIEKILSYPIEFIDLDISTPASTIRKIRKISPKTKIILSFHDFKKTPPKEKLREIADKIIKKGADIVKIATYAKTFEDSMKILELLSDLFGKDIKAICLCMGEEGRITRVAGHLIGNYLMYAPIKQSDKTAEGQVNAEDLSKIQIWH